MDASRKGHHHTPHIREMTKVRITKNDVRLLTNEATYNGGYTIPLADVLGRYVVGGLKTVTAKIGDALNQAEAIAERLGESGAAQTLGSWENDGTIYYDLGDTWDSEADAMRVARERGELAIWDSWAHCEVATA